RWVWWSRCALLALACCVLGAPPASGQDEATDEEAYESNLAQQLSNPVAALISLPLQLNFDRGMGPEDDGDRFLLNVQPVVPFSLSPEWNLISRTILPVIDQQDAAPGGGSQFGLGDTVQSLFFSPARPTAGGLIYGVGPALLLPTATDWRLGTEQWAVGPTGVVLKQQGPWTYGALANHLWSVAGDSERASVNATFLQPFVTYVTRTHTTFAVNTESTYDWGNDQWTVPLNCSVSQLLRVGGQLLQVGIGARYWAEGPELAPGGWGVRLTTTLLFPR
ncbi:MAG: hypothetical protein MUF10_18745, partial [Thermoanaerobaculaceae bacterium]|nr:hypothetical protein [Thermoanaerobaculaceae bacterium]